MGVHSSFYDHCSCNVINKEKHKEFLHDINFFIKYYTGKPDRAISCMA